MPRQRRSGPGRPPIFKNPKYLAFWVEEEDKELFYEQKGIVPPGVYFGMLLRSKDADKAILMRENEELKLKLEEKDRRIEELERLVEKLQQQIEKLRLQIQALKLGSKTVVRDAIKLKAIVEKAEEGKSWKEICALAGFRDEDKIREILRTSFNVKRDERNEWPVVIRPKDIAEEFHGWVLVKPSERTEPIDYILVREENLEKFLKLKRGVKLKAKVTDPEAEITSRLNDWYYIYMSFIEKGLEKEAANYLLKVQHKGLKQLLQEYDDEIVFSVVYSDPRFSTVFAPLLESLIRELKKKEEEVVSDV